MAYATQDDIVTLHGEDAVLLVAADAETGGIDAAAVNAALENATSLIDTHVGVRYSTPLASVPVLVRDLCIDIALYKLSKVGAGLNEEGRIRYDDAISLLKRIADGKAKLDLPSEHSAVTDIPLRAGGAALIGGSRRLFTRDRLRGY